MKLSLEKLAHNGLAGRGHFTRFSPSLGAAPGGLCAFAAVVIGSLVAVALASALIHPYGPVKSAKSSGVLLSGAQITPRVLHVFERSCQNCHSEKTEWPWYSYVAPASMMIESDVAGARSEMNLSRWSEYSVEDQQAILTSLAAAIRSGEMPPSRYTMIHPQSKLSEEERRWIYNWARSERQRLGQPIPPRITGE